MKATPTFSAFTSGELSPLLEGRTDLEKYFKGAKVLENMIITNPKQWIWTHNRWKI